MIVQCVQGSEEWIAARLGIPTSSEFSRIVTPKGAPSKSSRRYLWALVAERLLGHPMDSEASTFMDRGKALEVSALAFYALQEESPVQRVGFVTNGRYGCSPDGLVGTEGLLEIKVPSAAVHVGYMLGEGAGEDYKPQTQGQLLVTGRAWVDVLSYNPELGCSLVRVERNEEYIATLAKSLAEFCDQLDAATEELRRRAAA